MFFPDTVVRKTPEMKTPRGILAMTGANVTAECWILNVCHRKGALRGARLHGSVLNEEQMKGCKNTPSKRRLQSV